MKQASKGWVRWLAYVAVCASASACGPLPGEDGLGDAGTDSDGDALEEQILTVLRELYPSLSEEELLAISVKLDLSEVLALRDELEAARAAAAEFSLDLFTSSEERVEQRTEDLEPENGGYPKELSAAAATCFVDTDAGATRVEFSGVFDGQTAVSMDDVSLAVRVDGATQAGELSCLAQGEPVDIVFLIDITGSMSNVIASVRDSVVHFVDAIEASGVHGTLSVVTFQDTVGVDVEFQEPAPAGDVERSPFFPPASLDNPGAIEDLRAFVNRLEANRGADAPENLAGAVDFAHNNVIGTLPGGAPNVIGQGGDDPPATKPFPALSNRRIFVVLTDVGFHADDADSTNSSLLPEFVPRDAAVIAASLRQSGTVVHVSDPSWADGELTPTAGSSTDADYFAIQTGGLGDDTVLGYSLLDLELVVVSEDSGLLDIALDGVLSTSCSFTFAAELAADAEVELEWSLDGAITTQTARVVRY